MHGMSRPCMKKNKQNKLYCGKYFPKPFSKHTKLVTKKIHTEYRRRAPKDGGLQVEIDGVLYDNQWVVPYNPYLLMKYDWYHVQKCKSLSFLSHINVDICSSVRAVSYLCK